MAESRETYLDVGFNKLLTRDFLIPTSNQQNFLSEQDFNALVEGVSGSKITSGVSKSGDGSLSIDWDKALLQLFDGVVAAVKIGKFEDGTRGIRIQDTLGNTVSLSSLELIMGQVVVPGRIGTARLYVDNGGSGGKNRLLVQFVGGSPRVLATQP